jgi:hypothetical protein
LLQSQVLSLLHYALFLKKTDIVVISKTYPFMNLLKRLCLLALILLCTKFAFCQSKANLDSLIRSAESFRKQLPIEKLYLRLDKPGYTQGDTIWFKAYLFDADYFKSSPRSGLLYVELDDNNRPVKRMMIPVISGLSWGNIALDDRDVPPGAYTLRAYTSWMLNFGEDYVFKKNIFVSPLDGLPRVVKTAFRETAADGKSNIDARLQLLNISGEPQRLKDMQFQVTDGKRSLLKNKSATDVEGKVSLNFSLSAERARSKNLLIQAREVVNGDTTAALNIPVNLNKPENTDLQLMPEGGSLTAGLVNRVGFKAIGEDGKSVNVSGKIVNDKQQTVATFRSLHAGMGSFEFTPQAGETYTAAMDLPNGASKNYPLPAVQATGTNLRVDKLAPDSLQVRVAVRDDASTGYYLIGESRGVICYAAHVPAGSLTVNKHMAAGIFPTGVARFTLLNLAGEPRNERILYIDHQDALKIDASTDKPVFAPHDSVALHLSVTDKTGKPVRGSFSVAVTDDSQVQADSTESNIINSMLFSADLKGTVEGPGYYFTGNNPEKAAALDNLLLTQGWVGYNWKQLAAAKTAPRFAAEPQFIIQGRVSNIFNKPVEKSGVTLFSKKPVILTDTVTDKNGRFVFKNIAPIDTAVFLIQARNKRGRSFNVGVDVDEFKPPVFAPAERVMPWYVNSDTLLLQKINKQIATRQEAEKLYGHVLKTVHVKDKRIITGSKNLNGSGEADQILDEADMDKAGKQTLADLLEKRIKGYHFTGMWSPSPFGRPMFTYYMIKDKKIRFVFDGMDVEWFYNGSSKGPEGQERYQFLRTYLEYYEAEDIKGIEVMYSARYGGTYSSKLLPPLDYGSQIVYVEITTRSGSGPFMKKTPGMYIYKPLPFTLPKQFYRPRYNAKNTSLPDLRSTIHWQPSVITDTAGKATVSFYSAGKAATYHIIIEGTDMNGQLGYFRKQIQVR